MERLYGGEKYFFRTILEDDLRKLREHRNSFSTWNNLTSPLPILQDKQLNWLKNMGKDYLYYIIVDITHIEQGLVRITDIDWVNRSCAVGLDIFETQRHRGVASQAFPMLVEYCFSVLNMHRLWLLVAETNKYAMRVYEKSGFQVEGVQKDALWKDGKYIDYIQMSLISQ